MAKKASTKSVEKEKEKERAKEKDKNGKEGSKRVPASEKVENKEEVKEEVVPSSKAAPSEAEPRKASKIASFIPKGGKVGGTKKDSSAPVQSGIPKPGSKNSGNGAVKSSALPLGGKDNERPRSMRLGEGLGLHRDSRHSSSSSSLASTEGKGHHMKMNALFSGEDPETRRLRTVKNIADLRQNLEETMSSLRGTQITHSTLETTFDGGVTTEMSSRSILSMASRPTPLSWASRMGQSSPRLQAGDAPSVGNGYQSRSGGVSSGQGRYLYQAPLRKQLAARGSALCGLELGDRAEDLELAGVGLELSGYMSDGDVLAKNARTDELTSGYMTDGGLSLYTRRLNRMPDGMAMVRESLQRNASTGQGDADRYLKHLSRRSDHDQMAFSTCIKCRVTPPQTDAEKHSAAEHNTAWSSDEVKKSDGGLDCGIKMEAGLKWRRNPSDASEESDKSSSGRKTAPITQTGSWRRGMSAQVGFYALSTRPAETFFCPIGKTDDAKVSEKGRMSPSSNIVQHSSSDAGRSSGDEAKKTPAGRVPTSTFGFKKPNGVHGPATVVTTSSITLVTASGATITSGSATLGKIPKSSALLAGGRGSLKGAVDGLLPPQEDGYLSPSARSTLQYRSLPRPSRSGAAARNGNRSSTSSIESSLSSRTPVLTAVTASKPRDSATKTNGHIIQANQTDKEKNVASEMDNLRTNPIVSGGGAATIPQTVRQGNKYSEVSSPTLRRLFGGKAAKQAPVTTAESMKNSVVISNPHATLGHTQSSGGPLDSPSTIPGSGSSSPLYGGRGASIGGSEQASSPGSVYSTGTGTWGTTISSSSALGYPSVSSMHTSSESIDMSVGNYFICTKMTLSPLKLVRCQITIFVTFECRHLIGWSCCCRYAPSPQLRQEEARDWLRLHSAGGLQDSASNSPFSTGSSLTSPSGTRFNFAQLGSPTTGAQINLASLRNNSLTNQDNPLDSHGDSRLRNSCMSLDEKTRTMSRSGSFRDGFEEELDTSQEKVSALTTQLSANAHLVAAFEQSLGNMTIRLKSITMTAEQKDSELNELRKTIELLKKQNAVAQAAINGNNGAQPDLRMRRQHSSDSVSSITSATSHSSLGSNMDNTDSNSKKKKKNWLRSSFKQAFSKKKSPKSASSHSDIEEMTDSSLPSSPKLPHNGTSTSALLLRNTAFFAGRFLKNAPFERVLTRDYLIGCIGVSGKTKWDVLDGVVRRLFKEYIRHVDPVSHLGLGSDTVEGYRIGDVIRSSGAHTPELLPCGYLVGENDTINISLKGVNSQSEDSLVFETLIPKPMLQRYVSLLQEHRRIILSGPSGTGKSYLAHRLAEHVALREGKLPGESNIVTFNVDHKSSKELRQYLSNIVEQCSTDGQETEAPLVLILDNLHHVSSLGEIFNGLLNCKYQRCPYIIGTMSQATSSAPNLQLHHNFRWVLCANHMEPVKGFLCRFLRRKLIETEIGSRTRYPELVKIIDWIPQVWHHLNRFLEAHSSSDVTIGPRLFLSCPMDVDGSRVWFTDLWNYSIIPYMLEAVREGLQLYGRRAAWEDPALWVLETFPWAASHQHPDWPALLQLRPEDVGFDGYSASREGLNKQSTQSDSDADPLMNMLLRLKEAASCSSPQSYDSDSNSNSHHDDILDSSLESTL
uniref:Neuron navigator 2 n=1 Tax=Sinocyclocheilus grahami TaxID=75366 RepID=A0A672QVT6_SINGR